VIRRSDFFPGSVQAPAWCERVLSKFGRNFYGEPIFRIVFLPSRCYTVGGYWEQEGELSYKVVPKYSVKEAKWALERFVPAAWLGTPESWDSLGSTVEGYYAIGPFPAHGLFECCAVFSTGFGPAGYVPLEPSMVEMQARAIWMGRSLTRYQVRSAALGEEEEKLKRQDEYFEKLVAERSLSREHAMTFGMAMAYNKQLAIDDYKTKIIKAKAWKRQHRFSPGFSQGMVN
jgi:hypothetical protein